MSVPTHLQWSWINLHACTYINWKQICFMISHKNCKNSNSLMGSLSKSLKCIFIYIWIIISHWPPLNRTTEWTDVIQRLYNAQVSLMCLLPGQISINSILCSHWWIFQSLDWKLEKFILWPAHIVSLVVLLPFVTWSFSTFYGLGRFAALLHVVLSVWSCISELIWITDTHIFFLCCSKSEVFDLVGNKRFYPNF